MSGSGWMRCPSSTHSPFPTPGLGGSPRSHRGGFGPITHQWNPTASLGGHGGLSPSSHLSSQQEPKEPRDEQDKDPAPTVISYLLTN